MTVLSVSLDGQLLTSGSQDGTIIVWDLDSRQKLRVFDNHKGAVQYLATFAKPRSLALASDSAVEQLSTRRLPTLKRAKLDDQSFLEHYSVLGTIDPS